MASQIPDEGFHEIQLNGKQLVFVFMAATVASVVIFLCGVLVGRGVKTERAGSAAETTGAVTAVAESTPQPQAAAPVAAGSDPTTAAPPPTVDDLSYFNRLEKSNRPAEELKPPAVKSPAVRTPGVVAGPRPSEAPADAAAQPSRTLQPQPPRPVSPPNAQPTTPNAPPASSEAASAPAPGGDGYAVQVAALREHTEADAIARRLTSKGYGAYVLTSADGPPRFYRVRIGKFKTRREAETVASRLEKEEQFKPWITR